MPAGPLNRRPRRRLLNGNLCQFLNIFVNFGSPTEKSQSSISGFIIACAHTTNQCEAIGKRISFSVRDLHFTDEFAKFLDDVFAATEMRNGKVAGNAQRHRLTREDR